MPTTNIGKLKSIKKAAGNPRSNASRLKLINYVINNMRAQASGKMNAGILLSGHPGVGKTTFITLMAKVCGLRLISIEIPHMTEEHIVTIPFIIYDKKNVKYRQYDIELAESNLYTRLKKLKPITDKEYLHNLYHEHTPEYVNARKLFEELGGSEDTIPPKIAQIRKTYSTILFLDEFLRKTSTSIRNMLRGLLNKDLGLERLPSNVYPIFASNIEDEGVDEIPTNNQFNIIDLKAPDKEGWFAYMQEKGVSENVLNVFKEILEEKDLAYLDEEAEVYTSPRRWEEIIKYVDANLPLSEKGTNEFAAGLLTNIKAGFTNYQTGAVSSLADKTLNAIRMLIRDSNGSEAANVGLFSDKDWSYTLTHQIRSKLIMGDDRKYVPVISGPPGVGKTTLIRKMAKFLNLVLINIDCSTLSYEDVMGTPVSQDQDADENLDNKSTNPDPDPDPDPEKPTRSIGFSDSKLLIIINRKAEEGMAELMSYMEEKGETPNPNPNPKFKNGYKYLIFFDELNRTNVKTFNGLRKLLLEKKFDNGKGLPEKSIVVAAINPEDAGGGVTELTKHMVDVLDIIQAKPSWTSTVDWLKEQIPELKVSKTIAHSLLNTLVEFVDVFKSTYQDHPNDSQYYLDVNLAEENPYISPREYSQMFMESAYAVNQEVQDYLFDNEVNLEDLDAEQRNELRNILRDSIYEMYAGTIRSVFLKSKIDSPEFYTKMKNWMYQIDPVSDLFIIKRTSTIVDENLMAACFEDTSKSLMEINPNLYNYLRETANSGTMDKFKEDILNMHNKYFEMLQSQNKHGVDELANTRLPLRLFNGGVEIEDSGSTIPAKYYVLNEIVQVLKSLNISHEFRTQVIKEIANDIHATVFGLSSGLEAQDEGYDEKNLYHQFGIYDDDEDVSEDEREIMPDEFFEKGIW